jgi:hypothetical protein
MQSKSMKKSKGRDRGVLRQESMGNIVMTLPLSTSYFKGKSKDLGKARAKDKSKDKDKMKGQAKVKDKAKDKSKDQAKVKEEGKGNSKGKDKHNRGQVSW